MLTYFIQHAHEPEGAIKIGVAKTIKHRMSAKRDFPHGIRLIGFIQDDWEKTWQSRFKQFATRANGGVEWFTPSADLIKAILEEAVVTEDEKQRLRKWRSRLLRRPVSGDDARSRQRQRTETKDYECSHYFENGCKGFPDEYDLLDLMGVAECCESLACLAALEDEFTDEWNGPGTDCEYCCAMWGIQTILAFPEFIDAVGFHELQRHLCVYCKPITSHRRQLIAYYEYLDACLALDMAGWALKVRAAAELIDYGRVLHHRMEESRRERVLMSDAFCDWFGLKFSIACESDESFRADALSRMAALFSAP